MKKLNKFKPLSHFCKLANQNLKFSLIKSIKFKLILIISLSLKITLI